MHLSPFRSKPSEEFKMAQVNERISGPFRTFTQQAVLITGFSLLGFTAILTCGRFQFGSFASGVAYLRGERILPRHSTETFGIVAAGATPSVEFVIRNFSGQPVRMLGSSSSCGCLVTKGFVDSIPPGGQGTLRARIRTVGKVGNVSENLSIITDYLAQPKIRLRVVGTVTPSG